MLPAFQRIIIERASQPKQGHKQQGLGYNQSRSQIRKPQVLVLAPTRELTQQITQEAHKYITAGIDSVNLYGGASKGPQLSRLNKGVDVIIATPGRCNDLLDMGAFDPSNIKYLVLDEADRM